MAKLPMKGLMAFAKKGKPGGGDDAGASAGGGVPGAFGKGGKPGAPGGAGAKDLGKKKDAASYIDECVKKLQAGDHDEHAEQIMKDFDATEDDVPVGVQDADLWDEAEKAVDPDGGTDHGVDPWSLVAEVYVKLGGTFGSGDDSDKGGKGDHGGADESDDGAGDGSTPM